MTVDPEVLTLQVRHTGNETFLAALASSIDGASWRDEVRNYDGTGVHIGYLNVPADSVNLAAYTLDNDPLVTEYEWLA